MRVGIIGLGYQNPHVPEVPELDLASTPLVVDFRGATREISAENLVRL